MVVKVIFAAYYNKLTETVEQLTDELMYEIASKRKDEKAEIPLSKVVDEDDFTLEDLFADLDNLELDMG